MSKWADDLREKLRLNPKTEQRSVASTSLTTHSIRLNGLFQEGYKLVVTYASTHPESSPEYLSVLEREIPPCAPKPSEPSDSQCGTKTSLDGQSDGDGTG
jgi:hypothetical protein